MPCAAMAPDPGTKSPLARASLALKAYSTAAAATAFHSTIAARGARIGQDARASIDGTGPASAIARSVKASADTRDSLTQRVPPPPAD